MAAFAPLLPHLVTAGISAGAAFGVNKLMRKSPSAPKAPKASAQPGAPRASIAPDGEMGRDRRRGPGVGGGTSAMRLPPLARGGALGGGRATLLGG